MKKLIILILCGVLLFSCRQVTKSIEETFNPKHSASLKDTIAQTAKAGQAQHAAAMKTADSVLQTALQLIEKTTSDIHIERHTSTKKSDFLTNKVELAKAEQALRKLPQYTGKEIFIYSTIHFYDDGRIITSLRHPENPKYVDRYEYRNGVWSEPRPVQMSVRDKIESRLLPLDRLSFSNVARVTKTYNEKAAEVEGAKPATSTYVMVWDKEMRWYPTTVDGSRERYTIQFNDDGTLKTYRQD
jgi:hypothetical protein